MYQVLAWIYVLKIVTKIYLLRGMGVLMRDMQQSRQMANDDPPKIRKETFSVMPIYAKIVLSLTISERERIKC